jgi:acyl-CoA thioesterase II
MEQKAIAEHWLTDGDDSSSTGPINHTALVDRLAVRPTRPGTTRFEGRPIEGFTQRTYGGHLLGQAMMAAAATVDDGLVASSLHAYFLRMGVPDQPLNYQVTAVRDGRSLSVRSVVVSQGRRELAAIQMMFALPGTASDELTVCVTAPPVPDPESLPRLHERRALNLPADGIKLPTRVNWQTASRPLDVRYIDDEAIPTQSLGTRCFWFRADEAAITSQNTHRAIVAFASDRSLLPAIAKARGELGDPSQWPVASIDHTIWFHADAFTGRWFLYVQDSPYSGAHSGLARGTIFDENRKPVASVAQHGLTQRQLSA